jgi:hypothetical protein
MSILTKIIIILLIFSLHIEKSQYEASYIFCGILSILHFGYTTVFTFCFVKLSCGTYL